MKFVSAILIVLCVLCVTQVNAKDWVYPKTGFHFWFPDEWKHQWTEERACFSAWEPEGDLEFDFFAPKKIDNIEKALLELVDELDDWWLTEIVIGKPEKVTANGMNMLFVGGCGKSKEASFAGWKEGEKIAFIAGIYEKDGHFFMAVGYAPDVEPDDEETSKYLDAKYEEMFKKILTKVEYAAEE